MMKTTMMKNREAGTRKLFLLTTLALVFLQPGAFADEQRQKPNIVFIFADDWGWGDLSCHGHPYVKTPNIDRLAKEGTDFHRFTVASGVCSPSRTAVMTGHFPARYNIDGHFAWVPSNAKRNMPDWLSPQAPLLSSATGQVVPVRWAFCQGESDRIVDHCAEGRDSTGPRAASSCAAGGSIAGRRLSKGVG